MKTLDDVRKFWDSNPLWTGESDFEVGTRDFFAEHERVVVDDCFAGRFDYSTMPDKAHRGDVLDLGCGPGFWTVRLAEAGCRQVTAADLTPNALELTSKRCELLGHKNILTSVQNAEDLTFDDRKFDHVNCQGVIHHTPDTEACIRQIARVLKPGGTASISVYYRNWLLRNWSWLSWIASILGRVGSKLKGRGRESIYMESDVDEIVRLYDGAENPIGKAYSRQEFIDMLKPYFIVERTFLHFFPARTLPFAIPSFLHRILDGRLGFMIYADLRKRDH